MRILRSTFYSPDLTPMTTVVRDSDAIDTLEGVRASVYEPGYFTIFRIMETPDDISIEQATIWASKEYAEKVDDERNQAIQFYWATMQFQLVSRNGTVLMPAPAPFTTEEVREVFEQIVKHPDYTNQTVIATSCEGDNVTIEAGEVK